MGGAPVAIDLGSGLTASFTTVENMGGTNPTFLSPITVTGTAGDRDALSFEDWQGDVTQGYLEPAPTAPYYSVTGLGGTGSFQFTASTC